MRIYQLVRAFAFALLVLCSLPAVAQAQTDLSGLWTGRSSGNQVTIETRPGGFVIIVAGQRREGQYGDGQFFRDAGSGLYLYTKPDGNNVRAQVLGPDELQVTNPDGWTDIFARPPRGTASSLTVPVAPVAAKPVEKLPPARPAKTAPWSPKAMPTRPNSQLSVQFAAERADILASCSASIQQMAKIPPVWTTAEANLVVEGGLLHDQNMIRTVDAVKKQIAVVDAAVAKSDYDRAKLRAERCLSERRVAQLQGSPIATGAVDGSLNPMTIGNPNPAWRPQGKDAHIIASDGKSAMDCVKLFTLTSADSSTGGGGRVLSNQCDGPVEIVWCINPGECDRERGNMWTVQPGGSWPVSANGEVRWAACHGANTAAHVKGSHGLRYYCSAPAKK